jgi:hypothetical protein
MNDAFLYCFSEMAYDDDAFLFSEMAYDERRISLLL